MFITVSIPVVTIDLYGWGHLSFNIASHALPSRITSIDVQLTPSDDMSDRGHAQYLSPQAWKKFDDCVRDLLDSDTLVSARLSLWRPYLVKRFANEIVVPYMPYLLSADKVQYGIVVWNRQQSKISGVIPVTLDGMCTL